MSAAAFCEFDSRPFDSFCGTHCTTCCASCHSAAYPECKLEELSKATAKLEADVREYESGLDNLISEAKDKQESVPGWLIKQDERDKDMTTELHNFYSKVRRIVNDCEQNDLGLAREKMSNHTCSAKSIDKIVTIWSELKQEQEVLTAGTQQGDKLCPNGGAGVIIDDVESFELSPVQRADVLHRRSTKLRQAVSKSRKVISDFEEVSSINYEAVINKSVLEYIENALKNSCTIDMCQKPFRFIIQFLKKFDFTCSGTQSVMAFLDKRPTSAMIVATCRPYTLNVVTQNCKTIKSVALTIDAPPAGICRLDDRIYLTQWRQDNISVYKTSDLSHLTSLLVSGGCFGIGTVGDRLVVAFSGDCCVRMLTTSGDVIAQSPHVFKQPRGLAVSPEADAVFVTDFGAHQVVALSPDLATHLRTIPCGGSNPIGVCVFGDNIYACNLNSNQVMELSRDGQRSRSVISEPRPCGICVNPAKMCFMVSNADSDSIASYKGRPQNT